MSAAAALELSRQQALFDYQLASEEDVFTGRNSPDHKFPLALSPAELLPFDRGAST